MAVLSGKANNVAPNIIDKVGGVGNIVLYLLYLVAWSMQTIS